MLEKSAGLTVVLGAFQYQGWNRADARGLARLGVASLVCSICLLLLIRFVVVCKVHHC